MFKLVVYSVGVAYYFVGNDRDYFMDKLHEWDKFKNTPKPDENYQCVRCETMMVDAHLDRGDRAKITASFELDLVSSVIVEDY